MIETNDNIEKARKEMLDAEQAVNQLDPVTDRTLSAFRVHSASQSQKIEDLTRSIIVATTLMMFFISLVGFIGIMLIGAYNTTDVEEDIFKQYLERYSVMREAIASLVLPVILLVLGYYFGSNKHKAE